MFPLVHIDIVIVRYFLLRELEVVVVARLSEIVELLTTKSVSERREKLPYPVSPLGRAWYGSFGTSPVAMSECFLLPKQERFFLPKQEGLILLREQEGKTALTRSLEMIESRAAWLGLRRGVNRPLE
jgi:hypothetical protein